MKKTITILALFLLIISEAKSQIDKNQLAKLFSVDAKLSVNDTYSSHLKSAQVLNLAYSHSTVWSINQNPSNITSIKKVLVIVNSSALSLVQDRILRYAYDIYFAYGSAIIIEQCTGATYTDIKNLIISNKTDLAGVVLIGDLPAAWYEMANDFDTYGYQEWPCDLYYMDLDGTWSDSDNNGIFDSHSGNVQPEIFVGRISTTNMGTLLNEKTGLERYFDKDHKFWIGQSPVNKKYGLSYTDKDWASSSDFLNDIGILYGTSNYDKIDAINNSSTFGRTDYFNRLSNNRYEFIQLSCHSNHEFHQMSGIGGSIYSDEIFNNGTEAIAYNLFCCSGCRWTDVQSNSTRGFLGGAYVYNNNSSSLVVVGSTKIGSMLGFSSFYTSLSTGNAFGSALKDWWISYCGSSHDKSEISWHYGLSIIGDPLINLTYCVNSKCSNSITLGSFTNPNSSKLLYFVAKENIATTKNINYIIPSGVHVIFNAKNVDLNEGFEVQLGGSFEIVNEGCDLNCK